MTSSVEIAPFLASAHNGPPARLGQRYSQTAFLPEPGNTIVCHLDTTNPAHQAVFDARARMMELPGAENFLFTPVSSLHMTLFEGVIDTRRAPDAWPADIPSDAPVAQVTEALLSRLAGFDVPPAFDVRVEGVRPVGLSLTGASEGDQATMQRWRNALTAPFGYRHAEHDAYRFHITFAYPIAWIPDNLRHDWERGAGDILLDLIREAPVLPLRPPAFCSFKDMEHFEELLVLGE